ncbi:lysylphosphatidylglycerol synthase domain-containing protein [Lysobacter sp. H23M47]|uniref:lysylphosphatidylglycerol synthase domain-containing protein n=1 Tax=Lysobacter sp. H23M47 TaxID=2781024 RepID=UPI00187E8AA8|nr:lysylphosphatidylglycerol synthase domain-containing protein [Lysobacter sp. H23M47]QOW24154.1 flippase-like domain-containing protein [Lysobacter sp. H23M47]
MNSPLAKRVLRLVGIAVAIAAAVYFLMHAHRALSGQDLSGLLQGRAIAAGGALTIAYMALIPITALAWTWLLRGLGQPATISITAPILATTQLAKYLPGNVAHHLGRVMVARARGLNTGPTVLSMGYETLLVVVASAHISSLTFLWSPPPALAEWPLARHHGVLVAAISLGAVIVIAAAPTFARLLMRLRGSGTAAPSTRTIRPDWSVCLGCYLLHALNFVVVGAGLWLVAGVLSPDPVTAADFVLLTGAFAGSWILGFLAPGAPAGLGVREAILSLWLGTALDATVAVSLIIMLRIATTAGDLLSFLWGSVALARGQHSQ